jgi:flagellar assembly protein FliH
MALIRHAESASLARQAVVLDLGDLRRAAERMESEARRRVEGMLQEARQERERIIAGAREEGYAAGFAQGTARALEEGRAAGREEALAEMRGRLEALEKNWKSALDAFEARREDLLLAARADVVAFAAAVAERVTKRAVALDPSAVRDQIAAALALTVAPTRLSVTVCPEDEPLAREVLPALVERFAHGAHATLHHDPALPRGSAVVRTELGEIDASIDTQIERIVRALLPEPAAPAATQPPGAASEPAP